MSVPIESILILNIMMCGSPEWDVVPSIGDGCRPRLDSQLCRLGVALCNAYDVNCILGTPPMSYCGRNSRSHAPSAASTGGLPVRGVAEGYQIIACLKLRNLVRRAGQADAGIGQEQRVTQK